MSIAEIFVEKARRINYPAGVGYCLIELLKINKRVPYEKTSRGHILCRKGRHIKLFVFEDSSVLILPQEWGWNYVYIKPSFGQKFKYIIL